MTALVKGLSAVASLSIVLLFLCATFVHVREAFAQSTGENCALTCCDVQTDYGHLCVSVAGSNDCSNCVGYLCCASSSGNASGCIAGGIGCF